MTHVTPQPPPSTPVVPERPQLAPHVKPAGQMEESAFVDPPWLLERDGQGYIQVPRPLYRIAERADGHRTLDDIAREVSQAEGRGVSADNVRQLVATQFIPRGLVAASDGTVAPPPPPARSALAIARMKTIDPRTLDGITRALQVLHWPPVLVVVLAVAAVAQGWLYVVHGVGSSLHDAFYVPGFMLLVFTAIILSAGFHELGHAAALRYAGGKPRAFGFGMYLMYPAFFTDVSDNYRLGRWARIRTDLGGFYFNLIFALGIFALYILTGQEVLLVMVVLMNFEIIHQLLPFVRLDGYWTLADLTGIPDFFSRMGAFLRSMLPLNRDSRERTLPPLKWWGKAVFLGYIVVTIPALAFLGFLMLRSVPRVLATAWDALGQQGQGFLQGTSTGNVLGMAGAVGQSVLIVLPVAGLAFSLYRIGTGSAGFLWRWSRGSAQRRLMVVVAGVAFAGLLGLLWIPRMPLYGPDTFQPIGPDERLNLGDALGGVVAERPAEAELPAWLPGPRRATASSSGVHGLATAPPATGPSSNVPAGSADASTAPSAGASATDATGSARSTAPSAGSSATDTGGPAGSAATSAGSSAADAANSAGAAATSAGSSATDMAGAAGSPAMDAGGAVTDVTSTVESAPPSPDDLGAPGGAVLPATVPTVVSGLPGAVAPASGTSQATVLTAVPAAATAVPAPMRTVPTAVTAVQATAGALPTTVTSKTSSSTSAAATAVPAVATAVPAVATAVPAVATTLPTVAAPVPTAATAVATAVPVVATAVATPVVVVETAVPVVETVVATPVPVVGTVVPTRAAPAPATVLPLP